MWEIEKSIIFKISTVTKYLINIVNGIQSISVLIREFIKEKMKMDNIYVGG